MSGASERVNLGANGPLRNGLSYIHAMVAETHNADVRTNTGSRFPSLIDIGSLISLFEED